MRARRARGRSYHGVERMSWFVAKLYDRFMDASEQACLRQWRRELLADVEGRVLEVGAGTGANIEHYPTDVELVLSEPDPHMRRRLTERSPAHRVLSARIEQIPVANDSFDTVVATLVLCSVDRQARALAEIHRVLKPGGRYLFLEHVGADEGTPRRRLQRGVEPVWKRFADNCHLTRDTERAISSAGFELEQVRRESMRKALPWVRPTIRGVARKPG